MDRNVSVDGTDVNKPSCKESAATLPGKMVSLPLLLCVFVAFLSVLTACGNLLVIVSVVHFRQLHTPTNFLILSLAAADLLVGVFVLPFSTLLSVSACWSLRLVLCKVRGAFDLLLCTCSILHLFFISVDRYYVVCQPLAYRAKMTVTATAVMILTAWAVSAVVGLGITLRGLRQQHSYLKCNIFQTDQTTLVGVVFVFYLPAIIIFSIYLKILMVARSIHNAAKGGAALSRMERKATKTLAVVVGVFLTCWTPFFLSLTCHLLTSYAVPIPALETLKWFGWSNSMLNPLVYGFFYNWFRKAFRLIVSGKIFQADCSNSKLF